MIIVQFLNGRIPMLARTGLNFVDVRQCALGHLLAMVRGRPAERYLLGGVNLWLGEFLQKLEPFAQHRAPRRHAPHWLSYATACVSEMVAKFTPGADAVRHARIRADVARSAFFEQRKSGTRARLRSHRDRRRDPRCGRRFRRARAGSTKQGWSPARRGFRG